MAEARNPRYNLPLTKDLYDELIQLKKERDTSLKAVIHQVLKVGLYAMKVVQTPGAALLVRENGETRELVFF